MPLYSPSTGFFYNNDVHGQDFPKDAIDITCKERDTLLESLSSGMVIKIGKDGKPFAADPIPIPVDVLLENEKTKLREIRSKILDAVNGIGWRASRLGDESTADDAVKISLLLLDITDDDALNAAQTSAEMHIAGLSAYRRIADSASPELRSAFKAIEE